MFRKIVTESSYSPALAARLGEYIKKVRQESTNRQIGVVFVSLAVIMQLFSTLHPPESANASNPEVFIDGGIQSIEEYLQYFDQNTHGIRDLLTSQGITRNDVQNTTSSTIVSTPDITAWFLQNTRNKEDTAYRFSSSDGRYRTAYYRPLTHALSPLQVYIGTSSVGWFAITKDTGTFLSESPSLPACKTLTPASSENLSNADEDCSTALLSSLSAVSIPPQDHTSKVLRAYDGVMYTLSVQNQSSNAIAVPLSINLEDILEYAQIINAGGGNLDPESKILSWPDATLSSGESLTRSFNIRLLSAIPATAQGKYTPSSYDCMISARFGNSIHSPVACPPAKHIEKITNNLHHISIGVNLLFAACLLTLTLYLWLRGKQLLAELSLIRHSHLGSV